MPTEGWAPGEEDFRLHPNKGCLHLSMCPPQSVHSPDRLSPALLYAAKTLEIKQEAQVESRAQRGAGHILLCLPRGYPWAHHLTSHRRLIFAELTEHRHVSGARVAMSVLGQLPTLVEFTV